MKKKIPQDKSSEISIFSGKNITCNFTVVKITNSNDLTNIKKKKNRIGNKVFLLNSDY